MSNERDARPLHHPGEMLEVVIEKVVNRGLGLARVDGVVCLVRGAYPGERWRVRVEAVGRGHLEATGVHRSSDHPRRRPSPCPAFPMCGGCAHLDLDAEAQRAIKRDALAETLERARVLLPGPIDLVPSPETGWRTRATLHVDGEGGEPALGFHQVHGHRVVPVAYCMQLSARANDVLRALEEWLPGLPDREGLRRVSVAESLAGDRLVLCFEGAIARRLAAHLRGVDAVLPGVTGLGIEAAGKPWRRLGGDPFLVHRMGGLALRAHAHSFFQSNRFIVGDLVAEVVSHVPDRSHVLDLYAGVGLFGLALALRGHAVVAVEGNPQAVSDARWSARNAGLPDDHYRALRGDVAGALSSLPPTAAGGEVVVVDPPRGGLGRAVVQAIVERRPRGLVYVSCDPATLARDLGELARSGGQLVSLRAFDMFPGTFHVESVAAVSFRA